jgi:hypothetical protein
MPAVTFRDRCEIERGTIGADGRVENHVPIARNVPCTLWETTKKRLAIEGEVFDTVCEAIIDPTADVQRRDVLVCRDQRFEVISVFPGRNLSGRERFKYLVFREAV